MAAGGSRGLSVPHLDGTGLSTGAPVSSLAPSGPSLPRGHREGSKPSPDLFTPLCSALQPFSVTGSLCMLPPDPPPGAAILNDVPLCPRSHASAPPFMRFPLMEHLSCPPHLLACHQHLSEKPGPLLRGVRQDGERVGAATPPVCSPRLCPLLRDRMELLYPCLGSSWLHARKDDCSHRLPGGCGERRVSARAQLCRAPGVVTVRACGLMSLGEDGPDGHPLEADPRLPQHCTQSLVLRPAAPQSSTGTCPHVARRDGPPRAAQ